MELIIAGDLVPTKVNIELFNKGDLNGLLGENLLSLWNSVDIKIFNLEAPLTDIVDPIDKCGPNLIAPTSTIKGIKALNPSLITLANNHILDHGVSGLKSTQNLLKENKIQYSGVGDNLSQASKPFIIEKDGINIGIYTCAENEFTIATKNKPGANPFDPLESLDHIQELKSKCDYVIVIYHGGKELYRYPSPYLQKVCRKMIQKGANLVLCQHSHCIGCHEVYEGANIIYGQGNFIFNKHDNEFWNSSLLINIEYKTEPRIKYIPIIRNDYGVQLATGQVKDEILEAFEKRSENILQEDFVEERYKEFAKPALDTYLRALSGVGKWKSRLDRYLLKGKLIKNKYHKHQLMAIQNYIECEAHRELLITGLKDKIVKRK